MGGPALRGLIRRETSPRTSLPALGQVPCELSGGRGVWGGQGMQSSWRLLDGGDRVPLPRAPLLGRHVVPLEHQVPVETCQAQRGNTALTRAGHEPWPPIPHGSAVWDAWVRPAGDKTTQNTQQDTRGCGGRRERLGWRGPCPGKLPQDTTPGASKIKTPKNRWEVTVECGDPQRIQGLEGGEKRVGSSARCLPHAPGQGTGAGSRACERLSPISR